MIAKFKDAPLAHGKEPHAEGAGFEAAAERAITNDKGQGA